MPKTILENICSACFQTVEPGYDLRLPLRCEDCTVDEWVRLHAIGGQLQIQGISRGIRPTWERVGIAASYDAA